MDRQYVVTLHKKEDLEQFYNEMKLSNFPLVLKRPTSRNTHYMMTDEQAERLRQDPRVWAVELTPEELGMTPQKSEMYINKEPYLLDGTFTKNESSFTSNRYQWGHLHCAGTQSQRNKGVFGLFGNSTQTDSVEIFHNGRHVDVVICDDPVSYDCEEWYSPSTNLNRFVQYQWFNELNSIVNSIDDDFQSEPTGNVTYYTAQSNPEYHGNHVCGTVAGQHYGWAREANIYGLQVLGTMPSGQSLPVLLIFDYLRAFHNNKPINPLTGRRNPTVTNHSWGYGYNVDDLLEVASLSIGDFTSVTWNGVTYNSSNPNPSGWDMNGLLADFGIASGKTRYNSNFIALNADVEDAIADGVVVIGAAGNDNWQMVNSDNSLYNAEVVFRTGLSIDFMQGSSPSSAPSAISVGAMSRVNDFRRASFTNYGEQVDVFAPGEYIASSYNAAGTTDDKYTEGSGNWYARLNGTSMASPQVAGVAAIIASGRDRFTNADFRKYLNDTSIDGEMTFDISGGGFSDPSCRKGSPNKMLHLTNPRSTSGVIAPVVGERKESGVMFPRQQAVAKRTVTPPTIGNGSYTWTTKTWSQATNYNYTVNIQVAQQPSFGIGSPVAILLHGNGGNGSGMITDWAGELPNHALFAPNGYSNAWNIVDESDAPDYEALTELVTWIKDRFTGLDMNDVTVIGVSNGGAMAMRLALEFGYKGLTKVACLISSVHNKQISANVFYKPSDHENTDSTNSNFGYDTVYTPYGNPNASGNQIYNAQGPRAILIINSQNDPVIPYAGGTGPANVTFEDLEIAPHRTAYFAYGYSGPLVRVADRTQSVLGYPDGKITSYYSAGNRGESVIHHVTDIAALHTVNAGMKATTKMFVEQGGNILSSTTYTFSVGNSGASHYTFTGSDSLNTYNGATDPTIRCSAGDILEFNVSASGHPFWIKTSPTLGTGNAVTTGTVTNNGQAIATITWDTTGVTPGTYYYICQFHSGMVGQIIVN